MNKELIKLTKKLIKFPSTKDNLQAQRNIVDFIINYFKGEKVQIKKFCHNKVYSIVINLRNEKNPELFLSGHLDVVDAKKEDFLPKVKGKRLYGRGAGDMKGQVAAMIEVLKYFLKNDKKPSVGLMLTCDEEVGGENGVGFLLNEKGFHSHLVFAPDAGNSLENVVIAEKGVLHLSIRAKGKAAHGASPYLGENAIENLIEVYSKIRKLIPETKKMAWKNTFNLGTIWGGNAVNKVPEAAGMSIDLRFIDNAEKEKIYRKIQKIAGRKNVKILAEGSVLNQKKDSKFLKRYRAVAEKELGKKIKFQFEEGASDARFFAQKNIPVIITQARMGNNHSDSEWIDLEEQEQLYRILIKFISSNFI